MSKRFIDWLTRASTIANSSRENEEDHFDNAYIYMVARTLLVSVYL